jgi:hypothetical protein
VTATTPARSGRHEWFGLAGGVESIRDSAGPELKMSENGPGRFVEVNGAALYYESTATAPR